MEHMQSARERHNTLSDRTHSLVSVLAQDAMRGTDVRDHHHDCVAQIIIGCALAGPEMLDDVLNQMRDTRGLDDGMIDYIDDVIAQ
eukprot:489116-Rhodomonas_salina.3